MQSLRNDLHSGGEILGRKFGIAALVKAAYDWKMPKQEVIKKIAEEFQLPGNEAEDFVKAYYNRS